MGFGMGIGMRSLKDKPGGGLAFACHRAAIVRPVGSARTRWPKPLARPPRPTRPMPAAIRHPPGREDPTGLNDRRGGLARAPRWTGLLLAVLVSGCAWKPFGAPRSAAPPPRAVAPVPAAPPASAPPVAAVPSAPKGVAPAMDAPAIAARFPEPSVVYRTPGLVGDRKAFTTDVELRAAMTALATEAVSSAPPSTPAAPLVRLLAAGRSQRGVPIDALWLSIPAPGPGAAAAPARNDTKPTVMFLGQQHGDEPASAEALLVLAQQLARGPLQPLLKQINVLIVPRVNPDGALLGQRTAADGVDINRDHLLLRTPEAQAVARLVREHRPAVVVDAHEYSPYGPWLQQMSAVRRHDVLLQYAMTANVPEFVGRAAEEWFRQPLLAALERERLSVDWYHLLAGEGSARHIDMGGVAPDTSRNVNGLRHAVSLLIETRGTGLGRQHLKRRVHAQVVAATSVLNSAAQRAADLLKLRRYVDSLVGSQACQGSVVVTAERTPSEYNLTVLDPTTGADRRLAVNWHSSLLLKPLISRPRPCGYWLAADQGEAVKRLRLLGLTVQQVAERVLVRGEAYKVQTAAWRDAPARSADMDGAQPVPVELQATLIEAEAGSYFVALTQPWAHLAVAALEPDSGSSYLAHGVIDRADAVARTLVLPPAARLTAVP